MKTRDPLVRPCLLALALIGLLAATAVHAQTATIAIFAGQSNEESHGTDQAVFGFTGIPGGAGGAGINATAMCSETTVTASGATAGSGTLSCSAPTSGWIFAGQVVSGPGVPVGQVVSAANNGGNFPGATGTGTNAGGTYVVTPAASVGSGASPVAMTFAEPDIGGSGVLNARCQIWAPTRSKGSGSWETYDPNVNTDFSGGAQAAAWGPEGAFCQHWTAANPGKTLYMIKIAVGGSSLCALPRGNNYSPEFAGASGIASFDLLQTQTALAESALASQFGIKTYQVAVIQWGQGEQDSQPHDRPCGFPFPPFADTTTPVPYLANLEDLIGHFAIPATISASFNGWISGSQLTVTRIVSGSIHQYQLVSGADVAAQTYIGAQVSGAAGRTGVYSLQVYQAVLPQTIASSGGATCSNASISGGFFYAYPLAYSKNTIVESCVTGGAFAVGQSLTGAGVSAGTVITGLDSNGDTADGLYTINVNQTVASAHAPEAMTATVGGFGAGANTAKFVLFRTFLKANTAPTGVQIGQAYVNDHAVAALAAKTVNTDDALKAEPNEIHFHAAWISELGRRLYDAFLGTCDYHSPTC